MILLISSIAFAFFSPANLLLTILERVLLLPVIVGISYELVTFLDYELTVAKDTVKCLYKNLQYYSGGIADYFIRPIHRMDNKTLVKVYNVINKGIKSAEKNGEISDSESKKLAKWALVQIYNIQNNSKLINAIKTYETLK